MPIRLHLPHPTDIGPLVRPALALAAALILALAGCGGGGAADDEGAAPPPAGVPGPAALPTRVDYAAPARPLKVTPALDAGAGAVHEVDVPLAGATLAVTGSNGTRYTLDIPADALRSPTRIRMQAVTGLAGAPGGIAAVDGVELEPAGLHFIQAATLTIEPATAVPVAQQAFYGYEAGGEDLHALPGELGATARLSVMHFSGYGMATLARETSVSGVFRDVVPAGLEARLSGAVAAAFGEARAGTISQLEAFAIVDELLRQYESEVLAAMRAAAAGSCANALRALTEQISHNRRRQLLGLGGNDPTQMLNLVKTARTVCFEEANRRCRVSGNIEELIVAHISLQRQAELMGAADSAATVREETAIDKCGRYELQFDSTVVYDGAGAPSPVGYGRLSVTTRVPLKLSGGLGAVLDGQAEIVHNETTTRFNCTGDGCGYYLVQGTRPGVAVVNRAVPRFAPQQGIDVWAFGRPVAQTGTLRVEFDPGEPGEDVDAMVVAPMIGIVNTNQAAGLPPFPSTLWAGFYSLVNQAEIGAGGAFVWEGDWTQAAYPVMFERSTAPSLDNQLAHFIAITRVKFVHKPI